MTQQSFVYIDVLQTGGVVVVGWRGSLVASTRHRCYGQRIIATVTKRRRRRGNQAAVHCRVVGQMALLLVVEVRSQLSAAVVPVPVTVLITLHLTSSSTSFNLSAKTPNKQQELDNADRTAGDKSVHLQLF